MNNKIQKLGKFIASMILNNISAFVVWGLITALFIPNGWLPNQELARLIEPMTYYLLPLLIAYTGGTLIYEKKGGVIGAIATIGLITGSTIPVFAGAMIMGPLGGLLTKKLDDYIEKRTPSGFEMLTKNISQGLLGIVLLILGYKLIGPLISILNNQLSLFLSAVIENGFTPLSALLIEPGKILFLNNVINHGVLSPLGLLESSQYGKSILFLLETNPGPGLGVLLAYTIYDKKNRDFAGGASIIHFFGGIHEVYFPFVLANPLLLFPIILGSISSIVIFEIFNVGLIATPSPGSVISILALAVKGDHIYILLGILLSTLVTFLLSLPLIKKKESEDKQELNINSEIRSIVFACDAGMGSSVMASKKFANRLKNPGVYKIDYAPVEMTPIDCDLVIVHEKLIHQLPEHLSGQIITVKNFMNSKKLDQLVEQLNQSEIGGQETVAFFKKKTSILTKERIQTGLEPKEKYDAIRYAGKALFDQGLIEEDYIEAMVEREDIATTYIGSSVAIPHGTKAAKAFVKSTGIIIQQYPQGVDFGDGNLAKLVIGIAAAGDEHMDILMKIADAVSNQETLEYLTRESDVQKIYQMFVDKGLGGSK